MSVAFFPEGDTPVIGDTILRTTQKILGEIIAGGGGGGGGGSGTNTDGVVDPTAAPTNTGVTNLYVNTATGTVWVWPANAGAWSQII